MPRARIERALSGSGFAPVARATALGAASSSCSYAAVAIAKSLFQKGASAASALAFQFASTNLVWELGLVLWILLGWRFTLAEFLGGGVLIVLMTVLLRLFVSRKLEEEARAHAQEADTGHVPPPRRARCRCAAASPLPTPGRTSRTTSAATGRCCGRRSASASCSPALRRYPEPRLRVSFLHDAPAPVRLIENVVVGPSSPSSRSSARSATSRSPPCSGRAASRLRACSRSSSPT